MGSSNGTYVNEQKVSVSELKSGDVIRAGLSTFRISFQDKDANPHEEDGISFSQSMQEPPKFVSESSGGRRTVNFGGASDLDATVKLALNGETGPNSTDFPAQNELLHGKGPSALSTSGFDVRLQQHFRSKGPAHLYELVHPFAVPELNFQGLVDAMATGRPLTLVINETQLEPQVAIDVRRFSGGTGFLGVSQTLLAGRFEISVELWSLLRRCMKQDALICLGGPSLIDPESLKPHCNSLSYPSLLGIHLGDIQSPIRRFLLERDAFAVFEWNRAGSPGLFV